MVASPVLMRFNFKMKNYKYLFLILAIVILYLFLAHADIYRQLRRAGLKSPDMQHTYLINENISTSTGMIYVSLGDSLTAGAGTENYSEAYPYLVAQQLGSNEKKVILKNFSYPGAKTSDLIKDLLVPAVAEKPDMITLLIGTNDVHGNIWDEEFRNNYEYILKKLTEETQAKIYIISIPYIGSDTLLLPPYNFYYKFKAKNFNRIIKELADNYKLKYIDLTTPTAELLRQDGPHYSADAFHPSASGYKIWAKIIYDNINQ